MRRQDQAGGRTREDDHRNSLHRPARSRTGVQDGGHDDESVGERLATADEGGTGRYQERQGVHGVRDPVLSQTARGEDEEIGMLSKTVL